MPTQTDIQNTLLSASLQMANLCTANLAQLNVGNDTVDWSQIRRLSRNINALQYQFDTQQYDVTQTLQLYDCLNSLIGYDTAVNSLDPNYQPPAGEIVVVNPASYLQPVVLGWSDFSTVGSPDGGVTRVNYYNTQWKGVNPFMALTSPGLTGLEFGSDYTLIPSGGIFLSPTGNLPGIVNGQIITVYSYALA